MRIFDLSKVHLVSQKKKKVSFSVAIGNVEVIQECFPRNVRMGTARMK